jgi:alkylation response protein AidB-like acyl-CoA dehydrogenase
MTMAESLAGQAPTITAAEILARAYALAPELREQAVRIEEARHLPPDVVEQLRATGVFRMGVPRSLGGPELDSVQQTEVIEALATGDASAAWTLSHGAALGIWGGRTQDERRAFRVASTQQRQAEAAHPDDEQGVNRS